MNGLLIITIVIFLAGLFFSLKYRSSDLKETFDTIEESQSEETKARCPNILVREGNRFHLKNTDLAEIPGVNPITFDNLEQYTEFLEWQRSQGINCPVLYLEKEFNAQGGESYRIRPNGPEQTSCALPSQAPSEFQRGEIIGDELGRPYSMPFESKLLDASRDDPPFNNDQYPGFDPLNQYIGEFTPLDKMFDEGKDSVMSPNAMDSNWGGVAYSQNVVDKYYHGHDHV